MAFRIAVLLVCAALAASAIRVTRPELAMALALAAGAAACILSVDELGEILTLVKGAFRDAGGGQEELAVLFKAAGIALTGEYASQICRDAGEGALAQRVDFAVKISLFSLAAPMIFKTMKLIMELQQ